MATLTINAFVPASQSAQALRPVAKFERSAGFGVLFGFIFLLIVPPRSLRSAVLSTLLVSVMAMTMGSCGGGGSSLPPPPAPQQTNTPAGIYSVVVTGQSAGIRHNSKLTIQVQ